MPCNPIKMPLVRKAMRNHLVKSTSLEKTVIASFTDFLHLFLSSASPSITVIFSSGVLLSFKLSLMSVDSRSYSINILQPGCNDSNRLA